MERRDSATELHVFMSKQGFPCQRPQIPRAHMFIKKRTLSHSLNGVR